MSLHNVVDKIHILFKIKIRIMVLDKFEINRTILDKNYCAAL